MTGREGRAAPTRGLGNPFMISKDPKTVLHFGDPNLLTTARRRIRQLCRRNRGPRKTCRRLAAKTRRRLGPLSFVCIWVAVKMMIPFGVRTLNIWCRYYHRDPKRDHNFDNHPKNERDISRFRSRQARHGEGEPLCQLLHPGPNIVRLHA